MPDNPSPIELQQRIRELEREAVEVRRSQEERIARLNTMLEAVRKVRRLIGSEKNSRGLLKRTCDILVENRGYYHVWMAFTDESGKVLFTAESGLGERFLPIMELLESGKSTFCTRKTLEQQSLVVIDDPALICPECPLAGIYEDRGSMSIRLTYGENKYGMLVAAMPRNLAVREEEQTLFREIADDIAYALFNIKLKRRREEAENALRSQTENILSILDAMEDGAYVISRDYDIEYVNRALEKELGKVRDRKCFAYFYEREEVCPWCKIQDVLTGKTMRWERHSPKSGKTQDLIDIPLKNTDGSISKLAISRDITAFKRTENALRESEKFLKKSQEMAHIGSWKLDLRKNDLLWSDEVYRIFGLNPQEFGATLDVFFEAVHPDDRKMVDQAYKTAVENHEPYDITHRVLRPDGTVRIVHEKSEEILDESGKAVLSIGMIHDITERSRAAASLKDTMDIVNRSPIVVFLWENEEGWPVRFVSDNVVDLFGYTAEAFISGKISYDATVHADDLERVGTEVSRNSAEKGIQTFRHKPYRIITKEGDEKYISDLTTLRRNDHGEITHYEGILYDVSELIRKENQIKVSLKEKDALLSEIHHRVKNNMQIIISLLRLQAGKIEAGRYADMFKEAEYRIRSMALIHENLYLAGDFADIDFHRYVRSLVNSLLRSCTIDRARVKLKIEIENISLGMDTAIPCGLLINEVISNSLKHAFPDHREGEIEVTLRPVNGREFELIISDDGIGMPLEIDFDTSDSMGLMLVRTLAVDQLDGTVDLDRDGGTAFRICFKK